jgi:hypothetical protein
MAAYALCYGVRPSRAAVDALPAVEGADVGFVPRTTLLLENGKVLNTAVLDSMVSSTLAVPLHFEEGEFVLAFKGAVYRCRSLPQPVYRNEAAPFLAAFGGLAFVVTLPRPSSPHLSDNASSA